MKKLFVSVPMKGRTPEDIKASIAKMKAIAEVYEGEALELIDSYVNQTPPADGHKSIWYLSKSIEKLSTADIIISIEETWDWTGCGIEVDIAKGYGLKVYRVPADVVIHNYQQVLEKKYESIRQVKED